MASHRNSCQRRRSQSATTGARHSIDDSYRAATKRALQSSSTLESLSLRKCDSDVWRRGKRRRRDFADGMDVDRYYNSPPSIRSGHFVIPRSVLPSSASAFQLLPKGERKNRRFTCHSDSLPIAPGGSNGDIKQLRSTAFWELRRSVEQSGEGFVRRMQDLEKSRVSKRSSISREGERGRRKGVISSTLDAFGSDEEDDILICSGNLVGGTPPVLKRARSLESNPTADIRSSSPGMTGDSPSSADPSEDEQDPIQFDVAPSMLLTPTLTHTNTDSASSSTVSLMLPLTLAASSPHDAVSLSPHLSSRTEKAIAAITLAMANGAAGINDYETLQAAQAPFIMDQCQVGEMWH